MVADAHSTTFGPTAVLLTLWIWIVCCHGSSGNSVDSSALQSTTWRTSGQNLASAADTFDPSLHYTSTEVLPVAAAAASSSSDSIHQPSWNCFSQLECDALTDFSPPPDLFPFLPPPPLPASLLNSLDVKAAQEREEDPRVSINPRDDGDVCNLCRWANQENDTEVVTEPSTGLSEEMTWISILVVASLTSAVVGAIFMVILFKCRKFKILPMTDSCPILPDSYFSNKNQDQVACEDPRGPDGTDGMEPSDENSPNKPKPKTRTSGGGGWSFWRRSSAAADRPLRSSGSMCSEENSYSEEPYIVSEHSSALYAELNSVCQDGSAPYRTYSMNTYSEVLDPGGKASTTTANTPTAMVPTHRRLISDGTYENAAYVVSENGTESVHGSAATPSQQETDSLDTPSSSAYYSDSSNQTNGRKRKKKQQRPTSVAIPAEEGIGTGGWNGQENVVLDNLQAPPPPPPPPPSDSSTRIITNPSVAYVPGDPGGRLANHGHERYGFGTLQSPVAGHVTSKRPLPPPPPPSVVQQQPPPSPTPMLQQGTLLRSSAGRPLPPVPSQYV